jgi:HPt (histidine-containing phosphotransfer) domain-containing protein
MTSSPELLRFFHAEANEYLDALAGLVLDDDATPDASAFVAAARAMRGSATMARVQRVADLAFTLEQIGNALREGELTWSIVLQQELRAALADLRSLVAAVPQWNAADDQRAAHRLAALRQFAPNDSPRPTPPAPAASTAPIFIALQASAIAGDLESFVTDPRNRALLTDLVSRVRSLRGIAGVADHPPLGDVSDAVEHATRALAPDALLADGDVELFRAAAAVFRRASADLRARGRINLASGEIARFARATAADVNAPAPAAPPVVRIDDLFYADGGPTVVERGTASDADRDRRFRDDTVSRAEHARRLVAEARSADDPVTRDRATRDLRRTLRQLESTAWSFGAPAISAWFGDAARGDGPLDAVTLDRIEHGARELAAPDATLRDLEQRLAPAGAPANWAPASGPALRQMLDDGLSGLRELDQTPLSAPAPVDDDSIVPVDALLYRGQSALQRAIEVRDTMRRRGAVDDAALEELYDLLDLARTE